MTLSVAATLPTALALEIANGHCFRSPTPHRIRVDGVEALVTDRNSFTLRGLKSDTEYHVEVENDDQVYRLTARTKPLAAVLDPRTFGARGDGVTDDTRALQAALSACPPDGLVRLEGGNFVSDPLFLKSQTRLEVAAGASLLGLRDIAAWPLLPGTLPGPDEQPIFLGSWKANRSSAMPACSTSCRRKM